MNERESQPDDDTEKLYQALLKEREALLEDDEDLIPLLAHL